MKSKIPVKKSAKFVHVDEECKHQSDFSGSRLPSAILPQNIFRTLILIMTKSVPSVIPSTNFELVKFKDLQFSIDYYVVLSNAGTLRSLYIDK